MQRTPQHRAATGPERLARTSRTHSLPHTGPTWAHRHGLARTKRTTIDGLTGHRCRGTWRGGHGGAELRRTRGRFGLTLLLQAGQNVWARRHNGTSRGLSGQGPVRRQRREGRRERIIKLGGRRSRSHASRWGRNLSRGSGSRVRSTDGRTRNGRGRRRTIGLILLPHGRTRDGGRAGAGGRARSARRSRRRGYRRTRGFRRQRRARTLGGPRRHGATGSGGTAHGSGSVLRRPLRRPGERRSFERRTRHGGRKRRGRATLRGTGQGGGGRARSLR